MVKKYILHGGATSRKTSKNEKFYKEILESVEGRKIRILCVYFARPKHRWQESFYEDRQSFEDLSADRDLYIEMAEQEDFVEKITESDVIFINGGFKGFLKKELSSIPNLQELLDDKVVVGISAGANILSKYYYSQGGNEIREGIGLLPIKVFCHYSEELTAELEMLKDYKEELPVYTIPEEQYMVWDKSGDIL